LFNWALVEGYRRKTASFFSRKTGLIPKEAILHDLEHVHHDIRQCVSRIDIMRMGHAMIRPAVGSIFLEERRYTQRFRERVLFANSDLSGISIFEEAQYSRGESRRKGSRKTSRAALGCDGSAGRPSIFL